MKSCASSAVFNLAAGDSPPPLFGAFGLSSWVSRFAIFHVKIVIVVQGLVNGDYVNNEQPLTSEDRDRNEIHPIQRLLN
ncbi:MAG: hypothetical protein Q8N36_04735 [bacterium]|nr:hypothetical protein [bacterium]